MNKKRALIAASIILSISSGIVVYAADQTARLKTGLQSDYLLVLYVTGCLFHPD